ncbi:protein YgfX [Parendozoicomonas haliclonae]|uniref:Toxin CptA n=2 Tax=Parendozoicomonas haliclonae TaxID=1960125 RepID=A0A1X7AQC0_9GAMM|nr:protein YgfX [Parendozoicomonas haliclonae]SMA50445.1 hypothetical protein EHSB41UT_04243 [Parendozoicomonas haliclonae]
MALLVHSIAALSPFFSAAGWLTPLFWPLVVISLKQFHSRLVSRQSADVQGLRWFQGEWKLMLPDGHWVESQLVGERLVTPFLTVLRFTCSTSSIDKPKRLAVVLFRDAVPEEPYRQLRVLIRLRH